MSYRELKHKYKIKFRYEETGEAVIFGDTKDEAVERLGQHLLNIGTEELAYEFIDNDYTIKTVEEVRRA